MEDFAVLLREAEQKIKIADHLLSTTYPAVKEPKLLFSVIENIFRALDLTIVAVLTYEKHFKSLPEFGQTFEGCIEVFRRKIMPKYEVDREFLDFTLHIKELLDEHKRTATTFSKKQTFVIADEQFNIKTLTESEVKKDLIKARQLMEKVAAITKRLDH